MTFESFSGQYFDKIAKWIIDAGPGIYEVSKLSKEPEKFIFHVTWYSMCTPDGFNKVKFVSDNQLEISKA
jgi:hypothetical protein